MKARAYLLIARSCRSLLIRVVQRAGTESELFHSAPLPSRSGVATLERPRTAAQALAAHGRLYAMAETLRLVWLALGGDEKRQNRVGQCPGASKEDRDGKADPEYHRVGV